MKKSIRFSKKILEAFILKTMKALFRIFLLYFIDNFSLALVIPILSSGSQSHLIPSSSLFWRNVSFATLGTVFPLALLFGAPLIGVISDTIRRKKSFYIIFTGMIVCCFAYTVHLNTLN